VLRGLLSTPTVLRMSTGLKKRVLVAGLPGMGLVAKQVADYIVEVFNAKLVKRLHLVDLYPSLAFFSNGLLTPLDSKSFYRFYRKELNGVDLLVFTGDLQPSTAEGQHKLANEVIREVEREGVETVYTVAAYPVRSYTRDPQVYCVSNSVELLKELEGLGIPRLREDTTISGVNGLLAEYANRVGMKAACLLVETSIINGRDLRAAIAILKKLSIILGVEIDTERLEEEAIKFEEVVRGYAEKFIGWEEKGVSYI